jgi:hypothetical protein
MVNFETPLYENVDNKQNREFPYLWTCQHGISTFIIFESLTHQPYQSSVGVGATGI